MPRAKSTFKYMGSFARARAAKQACVAVDVVITGRNDRGDEARHDDRRARSARTPGTRCFGILQKADCPSIAPINWTAMASAGCAFVGVVCRAT